MSSKEGNVVSLARFGGRRARLGSSTTTAQGWNATPSPQQLEILKGLAKNRRWGLVKDFLEGLEGLSWTHCFFKDLPPAVQDALVNGDGHEEESG